MNFGSKDLTENVLERPSDCKECIHGKDDPCRITACLVKKRMAREKNEK